MVSIFKLYVIGHIDRVGQQYSSEQTAFCRPCPPPTAAIAIVSQQWKQTHCANTPIRGAIGRLNRLWFHEAMPQTVHIRYLQCELCVPSRLSLSTQLVVSIPVQSSVSMQEVEKTTILHSCDVTVKGTFCRILSLACNADAKCQLQPAASAEGQPWICTLLHLDYACSCSLVDVTGWQHLQLCRDGPVLWWLGQIRPCPVRQFQCTEASAQAQERGGLCASCRHLLRGLA